MTRAAATRTDRYDLDGLGRYARHEAQRADPGAAHARFLDAMRDRLGAIAAIALDGNRDGRAAPTTLACAGGTDFGSRDWARLAALAATGSGASGILFARDSIRWSMPVFSGRLSDLLQLNLSSRTSPCTVILLFPDHRPTRPASLADEVRQAVALLEPAFELCERQRQLEERLSALAGGLEALQKAVILIDRHGRVQHANGAAELLLRDRDSSGHLGELLRGGTLADRLALQVAVNDAIGAEAQPDPRTQGRTTILHFRCADREQPLLVAVVPSDGLLGDGGAIVLAWDPGTSNEEELRAVCRLSGLSHVESRLALLICAGNSLQEAAAALRIKEQTARGYLKQIFLKTDTRRQADLVRFLLLRVVRIGSVRPIEAIGQKRADTRVAADTRVTAVACGGLAVTTLT